MSGATGESSRRKTPLRGRVRVVSDKSLTHRGVMLALLADGETTLRFPNSGDDCLATLRAAEVLGATVQVCDESEIPSWKIQGVAGTLREPSTTIDLGNSGTGLRLLAGLLAGGSGTAVLAGDASLSRRPMARILQPLQSMGVKIKGTEDSTPPLEVTGGEVEPFRYVLPIPSAQVKSCLLLAGLALREGELVIAEPIPCRDHTERLFQFLGIPLTISDREIVLPHGPHPIAAKDWAIPGDISAACFFLVAASLVPESDVELTDVGLNPTRTGCLDVLTRMGANIEISSFNETGPEPIGDLRIRASKLRGTTVLAEEVPRLVDEIPVLAVAAAGAAGWTEFQGVAELRHKETDRVAAVCKLVQTLGAESVVEGDTLRIRGVSRFQGGSVQTFGDHRIAMAAMVAGLATEAPLLLDSTEMVRTSDPEFEATLASLQKPTLTSHVVAIDGGAGTGKTSTSAQLAERLGFGYVDSGAIYRTVALALFREGVRDGEDKRIGSVLEQLLVEIDPSPGAFAVRLDDEIVGDEIRVPDISQLSSRLAVRPDVRDFVRRVLRAACSRRALVVEGRDIGTVVFPDAILKVFLTTSLSVRAKRRWADLQKMGSSDSLEKVYTELAERDERDTTRREAPLRRAGDAVELDTSDGSIDQQVEKILAEYERVLRESAD